MLSTRSDHQVTERVVAGHDSYGHAFLHAPTGMAVLDLAGRLTDVNPALCRLLERPAPDLLGRLLVELTDDDTAPILERYRRDIEAGVARFHHDEVSYLRPDGTPVHVRVDGAIVFEDGSARYAVATFQDLTDRQQMLEAIRASHAELDTIVAHSPMAIAILDHDGRTRLWNRAAEQIFGWEASEVIGRRLPVAPHHLSLSHDIADELAAGETLVDFELTSSHKSGHTIDVSFWGSAIPDADGRPAGTMLVATDITERKFAQEELRRSEHRLQILVRNISDTVTVIDAEGRFLSGTGQLKSVLGYPLAFWEGTEVSAFDLVHPEDIGVAVGLQAAMDAQPGTECDAEIRVRHHDSRWVTMHVTGVQLLDDPEVVGIVLTLRDITEMRRMQDLVVAQAGILELIAHNAPLSDTMRAIVDMVDEHAVDAVSAIFELRGGHLVPGAVHHLPTALVDRIAAAELHDDLGACGRAIATGEAVVVGDVRTDPLTAACTTELIDAGFAAYWSSPVQRQPDGAPLGTFASFFSQRRSPLDHERRAVETACRLAAIAIDRHEVATRLDHLAHHDGLTGLPNRARLQERLAQAVAAAPLTGRWVGLCYCDLDRFKVINDSLGHGAGDQLLVAFADRLKAAAGPATTVARLGGDEFVVLEPSLSHPDEAVEVARRLRVALDGPLTLADGNEVYLAGSIGVATSDGSIDPAFLLHNADAAMYLAKERGRSRIEVFDGAMRAAAVDRLAVETDLRRALERDEIVAYLQPTVDLGTGRIVGMEALARWNHPTRGLVTPDEFIGVAEEGGLIVALGYRMLDDALAKASAIAVRCPGSALQVAVNLSGRQLGQHHLVDRVAELLERHHWPADQLCLELTESVLLDDLEPTLATLHGLRRLGISLAIDDFGSGYSSLSYLHRFPVDLVKVDRHFVEGLTNGSQAGLIATAVVPMAHALGLQAVGEGIASVDQLAVLRRLGCDLGQGYLFAPPLEADAFTDLYLSHPVW